MSDVWFIDLELFGNIEHFEAYRDFIDVDKLSRGENYKRN